METNNQHITELLPLYFEGELSETDKQTVEQWIAESQEHQSIANEMAHIYIGIDALYVRQHTDSDKAYQHLNSKLRKNTFKQYLIRLERIAAILLIPVLMICAWQFYQGSTRKSSMLSFTANPGMTAQVKLPDGSVVMLNSNSTLSYPAEFDGKQREVKLLGEAYFEVSKDPKHPFIVNTPYQASIKVYGTKFNVEAYAKDSMLTASLKEGSIALSYLGKDGKMKEQMLLPGQSVSYRDHELPMLMADNIVDINTAWTQGKIIFRNTPLQEVIHELEKTYNVKFLVRNPKVYANRFTGTLDGQHLDRILYVLTQTSDMRFKNVSSNNAYNSVQTIEIY